MGCSGAKKRRLKKICDFLEKNKHRMHYDEYLRLGLSDRDRRDRRGLPPRDQGPNGTGRDAMESPGCQAMLNLRTIYTNGDWETFQEFRIALENECLYPNTKAIEAREWPAFQAA